MLGARIRERLSSLGISQAELARRAKVPQTTLNGLVNSDARSTPHLTKIARALGTTPAYLTGEVDDPDLDAPPPPPAPAVQLITLQVALPGQAALTEMFEAQLRVFPDLQGAALARELARRLPNGLARLRGVSLYQDPVQDREDDEAVQARDEDRHEGPRARRT